MRDYQKSRCYRWENRFPWLDRNGTQELSLNQIIYVVRYLDWKVRLMPTKNRPEEFNDQLNIGEYGYYYQNHVRFIKNKNAGTAYSRYVGPRRESKKDKFLYELSFPVAWATNWRIVLHEYAHSLCKISDLHNSTWVSTYCVLLYYFHPAQPTIDELAQSLNERGIDFDSITGNPWFKGFARVKIDINKAPAFTNLVKKAWNVKKRKPNVNKGKKNWKLRVTNLVKKYPFLAVNTDDLSTFEYEQYKEYVGTGTVYVYNEFYPDTRNGHQLDRGYFTREQIALNNDEIKDYLNDPYCEHYLDIEGDTFEEKQKCWKKVYERCQNYVEIYQDLTQTIG